MSEWLWWLFGTLGVGGTILVGCIFFLGWPAIIGTRLGRLALAVGAAALAVFGIYLRGRSQGKQAERDRLKALTKKEVDDVRKERARIDALSDDAVDRELSAWDRLDR